MKRSNLVLLGLLAVFLTSWLAFVLAAYVQVGRLRPDIDEITHDQTPPAFAGIAEEGRAVYAANGCVNCHSQQVGSRAANADIDREWGARRTVARDYLGDRAIYLGSSRIGPDLANIGVRKDAADPNKYTETWFYQHLYDPAGVSPGSVCPPMCFLFDRHRLTGQPALDAIWTGDPSQPVTARQEIVPSHDAKVLVAYLLSLKRSSYKLAEAPEEAAEQP